MRDLAKKTASKRKNGLLAGVAAAVAIFLGVQACLIYKRDDVEVWAKPLEDGSRAVGLFNVGEDEQPVSIRWRELEMNGPLQVRDLWRQKDLEAQSDGYSASVPRHGVVLIKVTAKGGQGN